MRSPDTNNSRPLTSRPGRPPPAPNRPAGAGPSGLRRPRGRCPVRGRCSSTGSWLAPHPQGLGVRPGSRFSPRVGAVPGLGALQSRSRPTTGGRPGAPPPQPRALHVPSRPARQEARKRRRRGPPLGVVVLPAGSHRPPRPGLAGGARAAGLQVPPRPARHRGGNGGGGACARRPPCGPRRVNNKGLLGGGGGGRREACLRARWRAAPPRPGRRAPQARCRRSPRSRSTTRT